MTIPERFAIALQLARVPGYGNESPHRVIADEPHLWLSMNGETFVVLRPVWGSAAAYYRLRFQALTEVRPGWVAGQAVLEVDGRWIGVLPFTLYAGEPLDEPSMLLKYAELSPPDEHRPNPMPTGTWILTGWRSA